MQAIFPSFPAFFAQSPCSPANIVPAANAPAATSAMSLVIVEAETASAGLPFNFEIVWHVPAGHVSLTTLKIEARQEIFPLNHPFRISRGSRTEACVVTVSVSDGQYTGRGEGVPIARYNQSADSVLAQIELDRERHRIWIAINCRSCSLPARLEMRWTARCGTWKRNAPANAHGNWRTFRLPIKSRHHSQSVLIRRRGWPMPPRLLSTCQFSS